ncbi:MAG: hypothetical protein NUV91_09800 [Candidatus Omnitrophica bacterium]|nr:hypothetical protein [Candidatus Omnitrophota bacterium]
MTYHFYKNQFQKLITVFLSTVMSLTFLVPPEFVQAQAMPVMSSASSGMMARPPFIPALLKAVKIDPAQPFVLDFIVDTGSHKVKGEALKEETNRLVKYFLAALTVPEGDLWVNLSPEEPDRIVPTELGQTEMGRDMLAQDYLLKQVTASLMSPEGEVGKKFWSRVYEQAAKKYGTTQIPVNTFNKVWIVPDVAKVYQTKGSAFITGARLKVMLEEDLKVGSQKKGLDTRTTEIVHEVILPAIEKEVNEGKNFALLRQIYHSLILATWYKQNLKESILNQSYSDQKKINGINLDDKQVAQKIHEEYLQAFKKGAYNFIKEEIDPATNQMIPRKYFSGGEVLKVDVERDPDLTADEQRPDGQHHQTTVKLGQPGGKDIASVAQGVAQEAQVGDGRPSVLSLDASKEDDQVVVYYHDRIRIQSRRNPGSRLEIRQREDQPLQYSLGEVSADGSRFSVLRQVLYEGMAARVDGIEIVRSGRVFEIRATTKPKNPVFDQSDIYVVDSDRPDGNKEANEEILFEMVQGELVHRTSRGEEGTLEVVVVYDRESDLIRNVSSRPPSALHEREVFTLAVNILDGAIMTSPDTLPGSLAHAVRYYNQAITPKDVTISSTGTKMEHAQYNDLVNRLLDEGEDEGRVIDAIAKEIGAKKVAVRVYNHRTGEMEDTEEWDLREAIRRLDQSQDSRIRKETGNIIVTLEKDRRYLLLTQNRDPITQEWELIIIDDRFGADHAGRTRNQVYATDAMKAVHEITELRSWKMIERKLMRRPRSRPQNIREWIQENLTEAKGLDAEFHWRAQYEEGYAARRLMAAESLQEKEFFEIFFKILKDVDFTIEEDRKQQARLHQLLTSSGKKKSFGQMLKIFDDMESRKEDGSYIRLTRRPTVQELMMLRTRPYQVDIIERKSTGEFLATKGRKGGVNTRLYYRLGLVGDVSWHYHNHPPNAPRTFHRMHPPSPVDIQALIDVSKAQGVGVVGDERYVYLYSVVEIADNWRQAWQTTYFSIWQRLSRARQLRSKQYEEEFLKQWSEYMRSVGIRFEYYTWQDFRANQEEIFAKMQDRSPVLEDGEDVIIASARPRQIPLRPVSRRYDLDGEHPQMVIPYREPLNIILGSDTVKVTKQDGQFVIQGIGGTDLLKDIFVPLTPDQPYHARLPDLDVEIRLAGDVLRIIRHPATRATVAILAPLIQGNDPAPFVTANIAMLEPLMDSLRPRDGTYQVHMNLSPEGLITYVSQTPQNLRLHESRLVIDIRIQDGFSVEVNADIRFPSTDTDSALNMFARIASALNHFDEEDLHAASVRGIPVVVGRPADSDAVEAYRSVVESATRSGPAAAATPAATVPTGPSVAATIAPYSGDLRADVAEMALQAFHWAADATDFPTRDLPENIAVADLQQVLIQRLQAPAMQPFVPILGGIETVRAIRGVQRLRNVWRIVNLFELYATLLPADGATADTAGRTPQMVDILARTQLIRQLLDSTYDQMFADRLQAAIMLAYVEDAEIDKERREHPPSTRRGTARILQLDEVFQQMDMDRQQTRTAIQGQLFPLLVYASLEGVVSGYPNWNSSSGWNSEGSDLWSIFHPNSLHESVVRRITPSMPGDARAMGRLMDFLRETALWSEVSHSRNYRDIRDALFWLQEKGTGGYGAPHVWRGLAAQLPTLEQRLNVFGRNPAEQARVWFPRINNPQAVLNQAQRLATRLQGILQNPVTPTTLPQMVEAFTDYARLTGSGRSGSVHSIPAVLRWISEQNFLRDPGRHQRALVSAVIMMTHYLNEETVPLGYYLHLEVDQTGNEFSELAAGPVVARRFIKTPKGEEFDQIFVDAGHRRGAFYYEYQRDVPVTIIHREYLNGSLVRQSRETFIDRFHRRFAAVLLQDTWKNAQEIGVPVEDLAKSSADHEAKHGIDAHSGGIMSRLARDHSYQRRVIDKFSELVGRYAPSWSRSVTNVAQGDLTHAVNVARPFLSELSAMLQEARNNYEIYQKYRRYWRDRTVELYQLGQDIIDGAIRERRPGESIEQALNRLHQELFEEPLRVIQADELVLPVEGNSVDDAVRRAVAPGVALTVPAAATPSEAAPVDPTPPGTPPEEASEFQNAIHEEQYNQEVRRALKIIREEIESKYPDILLFQNEVTGEINFRKAVEEAGGRIDLGDGNALYFESVTGVSGIKRKILVFRHSEFKNLENIPGHEGFGHAGRGRLAIYASDAKKETHEFGELNAWIGFVINGDAANTVRSVRPQEIATRRDVEEGRLGERLIAWANGFIDGTRDRDQRVSDKELLRRQNLLIAKYHEFHRTGLQYEYYGHESEMPVYNPTITRLERAITDGTFDFAIAANGLQESLPVMLRDAWPEVRRLVESWEVRDAYNEFRVGTRFASLPSSDQIRSKSDSLASPHLSIVRVKGEAGFYIAYEDMPLVHVHLERQGKSTVIIKRLWIHPYLRDTDLGKKILIGIFKDLKEKKYKDVVVNSEILFALEDDLQMKMDRPPQEGRREYHFDFKDVQVSDHDITYSMFSLQEHQLRNREVQRVIKLIGLDLIEAMRSKDSKIKGIKNFVKADGSYDLRELVNANGERIDLPNGTSLYFEKTALVPSEILVVRDPRFKKGHAGRGRYGLAVYASTEIGKVDHELRELDGWILFARTENIATEAEIMAGKLGEKLLAWANDTTVGDEKLLRRQNLIIKEYYDLHQAALAAEYAGREQDMPQFRLMVRQLEAPIKDGTFDFTIAEEGSLAQMSLAGNESVVSTPGGIDLNSVDLDIDGVRQGFFLPSGASSSTPILIDGLVPIIIKMTPVTNLPFFLGEIENKEKRVSG